MEIVFDIDVQCMECGESFSKDQVDFGINHHGQKIVQVSRCRQCKKDDEYEHDQEVEALSKEIQILEEQVSDLESQQ